MELASTLTTLFETRIDPEDLARLQKLAEQAALAGEPFEVECRISLGPEGARRLVGWVAPSSLAGGDLAKISWTITKVEAEPHPLDRRDFADEVLHARKMEAVGRLAGAVTHDISNLLMGIAGCADVALSRLDQHHAAHEYVAEIKAAATRGAVLPKRLVAFTPKRTDADSVIDLNHAIARLEHMIRALLGDGIDLVVRSGAADARVQCDRAQLEQILMSLTSNARDAMPLGGTFTVEVRETVIEADDHSTLLGLRPGPYVMLVIGDDGCGMDEHTKAHAFEPFFTTKGIGSGTGLGLSEAYAMVRRSGGHIQLQSDVGGGTVFRILLPRSDEPLSPENVVKQGEVPSGLTILLVEDQRVVRLPMRSYLERRGFRVLEASDAESARRLLATRGDSIDVMLTDLELPDESGTDLATEARTDHPRMNLVYMSGSGLDEKVLGDAKLRRGFNFLEKPFGERDLMKVLRQVLG